ncbi:MAG TPA: NAD(P)/FAD-dependent oxidoreductase [Myxococcota bacterium]|nr:NAD(P)/FAD-dependent oxidoreductase [Myxococcota bacterium]
MSEHGARIASHYDAIVIGAGIAGLYQLYRLRALGLSVRVFETGKGVGGTWYWNRYPGARFDSESYSYGYSFSEELLREWEWSEHFAPQPETLRYLEWVARKLDLVRDISFESRVARASWDESRREWEVELEDGRRAHARFLITAVGILSAPTPPKFPGAETFRGAAFHTASWPHHSVELAGKCIGVIGTGATGIQVIQEVAKTARQLIVFQRTANYAAPLGNRPIDADTQRRIKASYPEIFRKCRESHGAFLHDSVDRSALEASPEEREAFWEKLYHEPGFGIWLGNYKDTLVDPRANELITAFMKRKIRERVHDPTIAEKLVPKAHGFGMRRVPLETGYYEVFNQKNVLLVDVRETPIERLTPRGVATREAEYELDVLIYATGFDAVTGPLARIDIRGTNGLRLIDKWGDGPRTLFGIQISGFPNLMTLVGPHNAATFCNIPRCIEQNVEWVTALVRHLRERGLTRVEASPRAEDEWTRHVYDVAEQTLMSKTDSWFTGFNPNLPDKKRTFYAYAGGSPAYRARCDASAAGGYAEFQLS